MCSQVQSRRFRAATSFSAWREKLRRWTRSDVHVPYHLVLLGALLLLALNLRLEAVDHTVVDAPVRADAADYFFYAYNTRYYGTYSRADTLSPGTAKPPAPDALRAPLYPLFIAPFLGNPPLVADLTAVLRAQALLSTLCIALVFLLARRLLPVPFALGVAGLAAISPHLVNMNVYLLSETLFTFLLVLAIYLVVRFVQEGRAARLWLAGAALAAAGMTHPMALYLVIPITIFVGAVYGPESRWKAAAALILGFAILYGPWVARNLYTLGTAGNSQLAVGTLHHGMYPDMMYNADASTYGFPYRADPRSAEISQSLETVIAEIVRRFRESPGEYLRWYIFGKPLAAWSWGIVAGQGDIFVYPVLSTPYSYLPHLQATHWLMRAFHWPLVALMTIGVLLAWFPRGLTQLSPQMSLAARIVSILLLYHLAVMVVGFPLPRYAIPMRPFLYLMALFTVFVAARRLTTVRLADVARLS